MREILFIILMTVCSGGDYGTIDFLDTFTGQTVQQTPGEHILVPGDTSGVYILPWFCNDNYIFMKTRAEVDEYLRANKAEKGFLVDLKQGKIFVIEQEAVHRMQPQDPVEVLDHYEVELKEEDKKGNSNIEGEWR